MTKQFKYSFLQKLLLLVFSLFFILGSYRSQDYKKGNYTKQENYGGFSEEPLLIDNLQFKYWYLSQLKYKVKWAKENKKDYTVGIFKDSIYYKKMQESLKDNFTYKRIGNIKFKLIKELDEIENNINVLYVGKNVPIEITNMINSKINHHPIVTLGHNCPYESVTLNLIDVIDKTGLNFVMKHSLNRVDLEKKGLNIGNIIGYEANTKEITNEQELNDALAFLSNLNSSEKGKKKISNKITIEDVDLKRLIFQFEKKEKEIRRKNLKVKQIENEILFKQEEIKSKNNLLSVKIKENEKILNRIDSSKSALSTSSQLLNKKNKELYNLQQEFSEKNNDLLNKEAKINAKKIEIDLLNKEYERQSLDIIAQNRTIKENKKDIATKSQKIESQEKVQLLLNSIVAILILFLTFSVYSYIRKKKANELISSQKETLEKQNQVILTTNKEITDSINYAKRIQNAILPSTKVVKEYLNNSFIYYRPKDIVAGDFYWMEHTQNKTIFAVADCTGHGVPGAMVSVICNNSLNKSVLEFGLSDPGKILDKAREIVIQKFEKSEEKIYDGMDIALCTLEKKDKNYELKYAGANNPLWIINNNEIKEIKADRQPIGNSKIKSKFTTHTLNLSKGDTIYIFTDGYIDQFGGEKGKKYKSKTLKSYLLSIQETEMSEQRKLLDDNFDNWRGSEEQIDDVCMIGVRI